MAGFEGCKLEEEGFKDFEVEGADVKGFEAVGVSFEDVVLEDRARRERDGGSSKSNRLLNLVIYKERTAVKYL